MSAGTCVTFATPSQAASRDKQNIPRDPHGFRGLFFQAAMACAFLDNPEHCEMPRLGPLGL